MDEDFSFGIVAKDFQKLRDLIVRWRRPAAHGNADKADAERFGFLAFPGNFVGIFAAQVDNGSDAEIFQFLETLRARLRATKKRIANFSAVWKPVEFQFFTVGGAENGRG